MKKKSVILTISAIALLFILNNSAQAQTTKEPPLTKEQIQAFRSAKIIRLGVKQSYGEAEGASFPFEKYIQKIFEGHAKCEIVSLYAAEYDITIKIDATGQALSRKYSGIEQSPTGFISQRTWTCYTGATLSGSVKFEIEGLPPYAGIFNETITPPLVIYYGGPTKPSDAPFEKLTHDFISTLLEMAGEIYGADFIIDASKEKMGLSKNLGGSGVIPFREPAIDALMNIGERAVEPLIASLYDQDKNTQLFSIEVLGKIKDSRAVEPLIRILNDKNANVRIQAAEVLGEMGDPRAVEFLISSLRDKNPEVRIRAVEAIAKIGHPSALEFLIAALGDENPEVRLKVVQIFDRMKDPRTAMTLIEALGDKSDKVRVAAAYALGKMKEPRAVEHLIVWLDAKSLSFRNAVIWSLGEFDDDRTIELLIAELEGEDRDRKIFAATALAEMDDPRGVEPVVQTFIKEKDPKIKGYYIVEVFGIMQEPLAVERLIAELKIAKTRDKGYIANALQGMTQQKFGRNAEEWEAWWAENKDNFAKPKEEVTEEEGQKIGIIKK